MSTPCSVKRASNKVFLGSSAGVVFDFGGDFEGCEGALLGPVGPIGGMDNSDLAFGTFLIDIGSYSYSSPAMLWVFGIGESWEGRLWARGLGSQGGAVDVAGLEGELCPSLLASDLSSLISFGSKIQEKEVQDELL